MIVTERERGRDKSEGEAGSMHREPDVGFDPGSAGSRPGPKAGAKPLRHPGIPNSGIMTEKAPSFLESSILLPSLAPTPGCQKPKKKIQA